MFRGFRRPVAILLWLLLALLPLRGFAQGTMAGARPFSPVQSLPCHGASANHSAQPPIGDSPSSSPCSHCDLCQAAAMPNGLPLQGANGPPDMAPAALPTRAPAAAAGESLFRPPRP